MVRRNSEEQLQKKRALTEGERDRFFALTLDMLCIARGDGYFKWLNPAFTQTLGWTMDELLTHPYTFFIHPDDLDATLREVERQMKAGEKVFHFENRYRHKDGSWRVLSWKSTPMGELMYAVARDVTERNRLERALQEMNAELEERVSARTAALQSEIAERKQAQEQLFRAQKLQAVGQLTGGIAHDFNNLLGVIVGNLDIAFERSNEDPRLRGPIQAAIEGAEHGAELTKRLLAFSRKQVLQSKRTDLNENLPQIATMLQRTLGEQIAVRVRPGRELWPCVTDPVLVEDAILNLAINARDAMPKGGTLTIETNNTQLDKFYAAEEIEVTPGDYVLLAVTDTGSGMPPEVIEHVFEPFFTTKPEGQGTGLGLSMVYGFVKQSKGHIKIYSELGHGTTVRIYLPRAESAEETEAATAPQSVIVPRGSETILVVDDNRSMRAVTVNQLSDLGYITLEVENAVGALDALERHAEIALMFSDVIMPGGMNGYELAQEARRRWPALKVLLTSGYTSQSIIKVPGDGGKFDMINKPFRMRDLAIKLRQILGST